MKYKSLIIFFVPPRKVAGGGVISIFSQCIESRRFYNLHHSKAVICTYPGYSSYGHNDLFENNETVYSFEEIVDKWNGLRRLTLHIPEHGIIPVSQTLNEKYSRYLQGVDDLSINVMTQNIDLLPEVTDFAQLFRFTPNVTQTTAHKKYATQALSDKYQTPVHHLSVYVDNSQYMSRLYREKENLIVYSPDSHPDKERVIKKLRALRKYRIEEIKNLKYNEYKDLISRAKFCLTFGEGFDGYFVESFFSGSIGFAVYNDRFFPDRTFLDLASVFETYKSMSSGIVTRVKGLDKERDYDSYVRKSVAKIDRANNYGRYIKKMEKFYHKEYDFLPDKNRFRDLLIDLLVTQNKYKLRADKADGAEARAKILQDQIAINQEQVDQLRSAISNLEDSRSWRLTQPLRSASKIIKKLILN